MEFTVRPAKREDGKQMLLVYNNFTKQFVGSAARTQKPFTHMLRKKENVNWVALDAQNRIIGYAHARLEKQINRGEFREIVVDPAHDQVEVAKALVEKVNSAFMEKKVSAIIAGSVRNPLYEKLFPTLGFFESESTGVFMYAILDVQKFLNELSQVFVNRLKRIENWSGLAQIECEGHSLFLLKSNEGAQQIIWTNEPIDFKVKLSRDVLTKLLFGIANPAECFKNRELEVETTLSQEQTNHLLRSVFPQKQFLIMDHW